MPSDAAGDGRVSAKANGLSVYGEGLMARQYSKCRVWILSRAPGNMCCFGRRREGKRMVQSAMCC